LFLIALFCDQTFESNFDYHKNLGRLFLWGPMSIWEANSSNNGPNANRHQTAYQRDDWNESVIMCTDNSGNNERICTINAHFCLSCAISAYLSSDVVGNASLTAGGEKML